jgi:hypothetical protein
MVHAFEYYMNSPLATTQYLQLQHTPLSIGIIRIPINNSINK